MAQIPCFSLLFMVASRDRIAPNCTIRHPVRPIVALQRRVGFSARLAGFSRIRWHQRRARRAEQTSFSDLVSNLDFRGTSLRQMGSGPLTGPCSVGKEAARGAQNRGLGDGLLDVLTCLGFGVPKGGPRYFGLLTPRVESHTYDTVFALLGQQRLGKPQRLRWAASIKKSFGIARSWIATANVCARSVGYRLHDPGEVGPIRPWRTVPHHLRSLTLIHGPRAREAPRRAFSQAVESTPNQDPGLLRKIIIAVDQSAPRHSDR